MTLLEALEDLKGCTLVHVDKGSGRFVFWTGAMAFLEYRLDASGNVTQGEAWSASRRPKDAREAIAEAVARYGL